jgi:hypothetical protein
MFRKIHVYLLYFEPFDPLRRRMSEASELRVNWVEK